MGLLLNYRDWQRSHAAIRSLLDDGVDAVVVWDNSADGGDSAARLTAATEVDARIHVHASPLNLGFAAGVNRGLELCGRLHPGAWILLLNDDARLMTGALAALGQALSDDSRALMAYPAIRQGGLVHRTAYYHRASGLLFARPRPGCFAYASGCCCLLAMDRLALPLFDEAFFMYGEDAELGWRLRGRPGGMAFVDKVLVEHEGSASSGLGSVFYETHLVAAHLVLARKLARTQAEAAFFLALRAPVLVARAGARAIRFRSWVPLRALAQGSRVAARALHARPGADQASLRQ